MTKINPIYQFLLAVFGITPDEFWERFYRPDIEDLKDKFNDTVQYLVKDKVTYDGLRDYNAQAVDAWEKIVNGDKWESIGLSEISSPYEFIKRTVEECLLLNEDSPCFRIEKTKLWQKLSLKMGEDIFSTSLFANKNIKTGYKPSHFQWNYILRSDFSALNNMIKRKKIVDNHFHLMGSAPNVDLSWIYLMNNPFGQGRKFNELLKLTVNRNNISTYNGFQQRDLYLWVKIAAYIRIRLFQECCLSENPNQWNIFYILEKINDIFSSNEMIYDEYMSETIDVYKLYSPYCEFGYAVDYSIFGYDIRSDQTNCFISGERHLYYSCLKKIYRYDNRSIDIQILFYLYLLIKNQFGNMFLQKNDKYGFENFNDYQNKKSIFIRGTSYLNMAVKMAIGENIKDNDIQILETRIAPSQTREELLKDISIKDDNAYYYSNQSFVERIYPNRRVMTERYFGDYTSGISDNVVIPEPDALNHFYVIHFIKGKEINWNADDELLSLCRESALREDIRVKAVAIRELRRSYRPEAYRILGIDAASSEINCRPENFGQVFRYLTETKQEYSYLNYRPVPQLPDLKKTYHVGEDFYDIVDGLRAIDEALLFLDLKQGDRIGHGVALGLDVEEYYRKRPVIALPKQNKLDNAAWMMYKIREWKLDISTSYYEKLKFCFDNYFCELYQNNTDICTPDLLTYMASWKLRGDNPDCYISDSQEEIRRFLNPITEWDSYCFLNRESYKKSKDSSAFKMIQEYHFNSRLKKEAQKITTINVTEEDIAVIKQLQLKMRDYILQRGVAVESCPSSNFYISNLKEFCEIPTFKLFPVNETDNDFVRLDVSINTDDQGVFFTSLTKEYALLVGTMQQEMKNNNRLYSDDKILNWIEHLINNGKDQCFRKDINQMFNR